MKSLWFRMPILDGYWGWFYSRYSKTFNIAVNEGGNHFAANLFLKRWSVGYYFALHIWDDYWFTRYKGA